MEPAVALLATLVAYKVALLGVGFWASRRAGTRDDFHLAGRGLGPWVASISAAASSSSAWTLLGVSGAAYTWGLSAVWLFPACMLGFVVNGWVVAGPLRRLSRETGTVTLLGLLAHGLDPRWARAMFRVGGTILIFSLLVYVASQFKAAGVTFAETFGMGEVAAILVGGGIVLVYTMSGGFWAVSVTDLLQGIVMAVAAVLVPVVALDAVGGPTGLLEGLRAGRDALAGENAALALDWTRGYAGPALLGFVVGTLGIGLGYPGQPHVVNRFMALREHRDVRKAAWIGVGWACVIYSGMLIAGLCGRVLISDIGNNEAVLLALTGELFPPILAGVIIAAILSAIMSTADSQLLACGSTVSQDWGRGLLGNKSSGGSLDRLTVAGIGAAAIGAAILIDQSIFDSVLFAWSVLGAAFGPLLLVRLWKGPVGGPWALASICAGAGTSIFWAFLPALHEALYELVPAFILAFGIAMRGNNRWEKG